MKKGLNPSDKKMMVSMFEAGASITQVAKTTNVDVKVIDSFAKYYRDKKIIKKTPKD